LLGLPIANAQKGETPAVASKPEHQTTQRQRLNLKIQDGCDGNCSYCIVRLARGSARSVSEHEVLTAALAAEASGISEIVLTGINLGQYQAGDQKLPDLLRALLSSVSESRFRHTSLEPNDVDDRLLELIAESSGRVCAHLHLPLQSASDRVLALMRRPYQAADFRATVKRIRQALPQIALSTDVMVGFPTESEADFQATYDFCAEIAFMRLHVFRYSARPGTDAAAMDVQVAAEAKNERSCKLRALGESLAQRDLEARIGSTELVLVERSGHATSESYHRVRVSDDLAPGSLIAQHFVACEGLTLIGESCA
jgi:threonylcarbamoyladenosine tRNA methylthiotransferase MtaB